MQLDLIATAVMAVPTTAIVYSAYWRMMSRDSTLQRINVVDHAKETQVLRKVHSIPARMGKWTHHEDTVVEGDLVVDGDERFLNPLKITGDLVITGAARFEGIVTVNGYVHVQNGAEASFRKGLVVKADLLADGRTTMGKDGRGWCVARRISGHVACGDCLETNADVEKAA